MIMGGCPYDSLNEGEPRWGTMAYGSQRTTEASKEVISPRRGFSYVRGLLCLNVCSSRA